MPCCRSRWIAAAGPTAALQAAAAAPAAAAAARPSDPSAASLPTPCLPRAPSPACVFQCGGCRAVLSDSQEFVCTLTAPDGAKCVCLRGAARQQRGGWAAVGAGRRQRCARQLACGTEGAQGRVCDSPAERCPLHGSRVRGTARPLRLAAPIFAPVSPASRPCLPGLSEARVDRIPTHTALGAAASSSGAQRSGSAGGERCTHFAVCCAGCGAAVGRLYTDVPASLAPIRNQFCLEAERCTTYELGSAEMRAPGSSGAAQQQQQGGAAAAAAAAGAGGAPAGVDAGMALDLLQRIEHLEASLCTVSRLRHGLANLDSPGGEAARSWYAPSTAGCVPGARASPLLTGPTPTPLCCSCKACRCCMMHSYAGCRATRGTRRLRRRVAAGREQRAGCSVPQSLLL